jgi:hypothetical protein
MKSRSTPERFSDCDDEQHQGEKHDKLMVLPYFCPLSPDTDADRLAKGIAGYLASEGVEDIAALPVAIGILAAVQTFALRGADAACDYLAKRAAPYRQNKGVTGAGGIP